MKYGDWVVLREITGATSSSEADLLVAQLNSAGIAAVRIPPTDIAGLLQAGLPVKVLVPPEMEDAANQVMAANEWVVVAHFEGADCEEQVARYLVRLNAARLEYIRFPYDTYEDALSTDYVEILVPAEDAANAPKQ